MHGPAVPGSRRPGAWRAGLLAGAAVCLAVAAVVALAVGGREPAEGREPAVAADPGGPAVVALLHAHARALLDRDRDAYAAGLDDAPAAAQFRATQLAAFDHTDGVPFTSFDLGYDRTVVDARSVDAARTRLGDDTAGIVRADLTYAFTGIDAEPARHTVYLTVVHTGGGWKLAGDTDLAAAGGPSWRGPWDFGPLVVARGAGCVVLAHPASDAPVDVVAAQAQVRAVAADVDAAMAAVDGVWGTAWPQRVAVVVAATQPEMDAVAGAGYPLGSVAAVAVAEPTTSVTAGPDVAAGQRVVMSGPTLPGLTAVGRSVLLRHELTHVATRAVTVDGMPTWVIEGFADYIGNLAGTQPPRTVAAELAARVRTALPAALPADDDFVPADGSAGDAGTSGTGTGPATTAAVAYEQAWYAFRTIADLGGASAPAAFYRAVASAVGAGQAPAVAVDAALQRFTHATTAAFTGRWRDLIEAELG